MARYALIRLLQAIPMVAAVIILVFLMLQFTPGDPVQAIVGQYPVPPEFRAAIVRQYHLDDPLPARLLQYFVNLLHGDLGFSYQEQDSVAHLIAQRAPRTLLLAASAFVIGVPLGVGIGL